MGRGRRKCASAGVADVLRWSRRPRWALALLLGGGAERFGVGPAVMLRQHLANVAGPVGEGAVTELAAGDRQMGDGHREAARTWHAHRLPSCQPCQSDRDCTLTRTHDSRQIRTYPRTAVMGVYASWPTRLWIEGGSQQTPCSSGSLAAAGSGREGWRNKSPVNGVTGASVYAIVARPAVVPGICSWAWASGLARATCTPVPDDILSPYSCSYQGRSLHPPEG
jgi:hypothetical protein